MNTEKHSDAHRHAHSTGESRVEGESMCVLLRSVAVWCSGRAELSIYAREGVYI